MGGARMWSGYFDTLKAAGVRYLAPNMPGHEDTPGASSSKPEDMGKPRGPVDIVKALMDSVGEQKAVLVGFDWGAGIAAEFTLTYPKRVKRIALWCMSYRDEDRLKGLAKRSKDIMF